MQIHHSAQKPSVNIGPTYYGKMAYLHVRHMVSPVISCQNGVSARTPQGPSVISCQNGVSACTPYGLSGEFMPKWRIQQIDPLTFTVKSWSNHGKMVYLQIHPLMSMVKSPLRKGVYPQTKHLVSNMKSWPIGVYAEAPFVFKDKLWQSDISWDVPYI